MIHEVVHFVNNNMLPNEEKITDRDIVRCQPIGRKVIGRRQQIIVKFSNKIKSKVFASKTKLKGQSDRTFINEDLTTLNHGVVKSLLELRKLIAFGHQMVKFSSKSPTKHRLSALISWMTFPLNLVSHPINSKLDLSTNPFKLNGISHSVSFFSLSFKFQLSII